MFSFSVAGIFKQLLIYSFNAFCICTWSICCSIEIQFFQVAFELRKIMYIFLCNHVFTHFFFVFILYWISVIKGWDYPDLNNYRRNKRICSIPTCFIIERRTPFLFVERLMHICKKCAFHTQFWFFFTLIFKRCFSITDSISK